MSIVSSFPNKDSNTSTLVVEGGGQLDMDPSLGNGPYNIQMTEEEEGDLSASQVGYNNVATGMVATDVQAAITELFTNVSEGKSLIAAAVTDKGVETAADATFQQMANNIVAIETGPSLNTATVTFGASQGSTMLSVVDSNMEYKRLESPKPWISPTTEIVVNVPCIITIDYYSAFSESVTGQCTKIKSIEDIELGIMLSAYLVTGDTQVSVG